MEQRDVLRHHADRFAQAVLGDAGDVLSVDEDAAGLNVIETLQQREHRRLSGPRGTDQADAFSGREIQVQVFEYLLAVAVAELDVLEFHAGAAAHQRSRFRMIAQLVRHQQCRQRLREARDMLCDIDQRHGKVARRVEHRNTQGADQHHVAGRRRAALPEHDRPGQQAQHQTIVTSA